MAQAQLTAAALREYNVILAMSGVVALKAIFEEEGFALRVVGGVVRDLLRGIQPKDIDMATTARPEVMIELLKKRAIRVVETGLQHGTITAVIDKVEYEITTLRIDTDTDGRHCTVVYVTNVTQTCLLLLFTQLGGGKGWGGEHPINVLVGSNVPLPIFADVRHIDDVIIFLEDTRRIGSRMPFDGILQLMYEKCDEK